MQAYELNRWLIKPKLGFLSEYANEKLCYLTKYKISYNQMTCTQNKLKQLNKLTK